MDLIDFVESSVYQNYNHNKLLKEAAAKQNDFDQAKKYKVICDNILKDYINELENKKKAFVAQDDFDQAKAIHLQLQSLKTNFNPTSSNNTFIYSTIYSHLQYFDHLFGFFNIGN